MPAFLIPISKVLVDLFMLRIIFDIYQKRLSKVFCHASHCLKELQYNSSYKIQQFTSSDSCQGMLQLKLSLKPNLMKIKTKTINALTTSICHFCFVFEVYKQVKPNSIHMIFFMKQRSVHNTMHSFGNTWSDYGKTDREREKIKEPKKSVKGEFLFA